MASTRSVSVVDGNLQIYGKPILTRVPEDLVVKEDENTANNRGAFLGTCFPEKNSRHVFPIGCLQGHRFVCCFRFKLWWMTQRMGTLGREVPLETQFLLLESRSDSAPTEPETEENTVYIMFLPLLEGQFRASLQGNERDELEVCLESGDPTVQTSEGMHSVYIHAGTNPYQVISESFRAMEAHLQTFQCREKKKMPGMLDWFGWCTWNAFYTEVTALGVLEGAKSLMSGGTPPRFLIIDDGWQSVESNRPATDLVTDGTQYASRLIHLKENRKFQEDGHEGHRQEDPSLGLQHFIQKLKQECSFKYIYMWHAVIGYWGGVKPGVAGMEHFDSDLTYPVHSPGILQNQPEMALDSLTVNGLGVVNPQKVSDFYNELHGYLAAAGVDGVKVDVQSILETLGTGHGGRVLLTRQYQQALQASVQRNFPDNGCIACMSHHTDAIYSSQHTAVVRASDDFWPQDPASHTIHIASVAFNSLFLGEIMQPDWDMFQSLHPAAEFHAAARAIGGCPIYVSDEPGKHDFDLLKKLVLPDGSILRAQLPGRPTRDSLFSDPARDGCSLLKIWNMNEYTGILGAFNCQGAGWCKNEKKNVIHDQSPKALTGKVCADDIDLLSTIAEKDWDGDTIFHKHRTGELVLVPKTATLSVTLQVLEYEVFTVVPLKTLGTGVRFAPVGISHMFNSGGAIESMEVFNLNKEDNKSELIHKTPSDLSSPLTSLDIHSSSVAVKLSIHGYGQFTAYSSQRPNYCIVDSIITDFTYEEQSGCVTLILPKAEDQLSQLTFNY
ncbi:hypothetical protein O6H91_21G032000 [Diphasiastrum complanatum]|nr:hypothetical protein O6H91_21G032000 [Diphasiastrum complanatum]KAJ7517625.1 hypothetical protein O6H91_21G032000 [Diphasiastrum complanatum]